MNHHMTDSIPTTGDKAPGFNLPRDGGGALSLADLSGKTVVLYFYPKDDTPGCTTEALDFSAALPDFDAANAVVVGISRDSVKKHDKFRDKHALKVALIADEDGTVCGAYGTWVEKSMYGRKYMGIDRSTFVIGPDGVIRAAWRGVKVPGHVAAVLAAVQAV